MSRIETVEEFLARGGQIDTIPRGAMTEAGWTPAQLTRLATTGNTGQGIKPPTLPESVPVTGVHRVPNTKRHEQPEPRSPSAVTASRATKPTRSPTPRPTSKPEASSYANRNGADGAKTRAILEALAGGWRRSSEVVKVTGQSLANVCARLRQLGISGAVISYGTRPNTLWALPGTAPPEAAALQSSEFAGLTNLQLLDKAHQAREKVRECNRLVVRIEREIKARTRAEKGRAA